MHTFVDSVKKNTSVIYILKNNGPSTEPYGIPKSSSIQLLKLVLIFVLCQRLERKLFICLNVDSADADTDSTDATDSVDSVDSTDSADSADLTDSADLADSANSTDSADSDFNPHLDSLGYF